MRKKDTGAPATPTIQVIQRMFSLIDVLASREDAVSLKEIKATPELAGIELVRQSRLSVSAVRPDEWARIVAMSKRKAPPTD